MKIELDVDPGQLGKSLADIMGSLTADEKRAMAKSALEGWLREPYDIERAEKERWAIEQVKIQSRNEYRQVVTDKEARESYRFGDFMRNWKSTKEEMVEKITAEVIAHYKAEVTRIVQEDPKVLAMRAEVVKIMMETFPKIAHEAMTVFVVEQFRGMLEATHGLQARLDHMGTQTSDVASRLMQVATRVGIGG